MCNCSQTIKNAEHEAAVAPKRALCPTNMRAGKPIDLASVKAQLAAPPTEMLAAGYRFCADLACPTVYYSADGEQVFTEDDLLERVYHKHPNENDTFICYCFRHTIGSIRAEWQATGTSTVIDSITSGIQAGKCACDIRNPQGSCCLGNVRALVRDSHLTMGL